MFGCCFDFAAILTQLGRDPVQPQLAIDLVLGCAGDALVVFKREQSVLAQGETLL